MTDIRSVLAARHSVHGDFTDHARITQALKALIGDKPLTSVQREALEMIMHKIGRILAGNPNYRDHWIDICGYAQLVADRCEEPSA